MPFLNHLPELLVVMVVALLIFGPKRLPEIGNSLGKTIKEFRKTMSENSLTEPTAATPTQIPPANPTLPSVIEAPTSEPVAK